MTKKRINKLLDWLLKMVGYALILICISTIMGSEKSIYIDPSYFGLWGFLTAVIIYILNKTIKPIIFWLTLPITGLTLGLFYPLINVFILHIADLILFKHFDITGGIVMSIVVALLISLLNLLLDHFVLEKVAGKEK